MIEATDILPDTGSSPCAAEPHPDGSHLPVNRTIHFVFCIDITHETNDEK